MLVYVIRKIWNKMDALAIMVMILIGMIVGNIVYSVVLNRVLVRDLNNYMTETGIYPLQNRIEIRMDRIRSDRSVARS